MFLRSSSPSAASVHTRRASPSYSSRMCAASSFTRFAIEPGKRCTAGGVALESLDERLMLKSRPGVFVAGEMLDWEAPTGGYLLTASMASGLVAGDGAAAFLN